MDKPNGLDSPLVPKLLERAAAVNVWVYGRINGRVMSQGGLPQHPWYRNVQSNPDVTVQVGGGARPMCARTATPPERAEFWSRLVDLYADFESYQSWTHREIPFVLCEPVAS